MPTSLGDQGLAAMMSVHATIRTLDPLLDNAVEQGPTVVTPCGLVVRRTLELVRAWLL